MTHGHEARIRRIRESGNKLTHARIVVLEALERFVRKAPLRQIHESVFGVLALESEELDPRL